MVLLSGGADSQVQRWETSPNPVPNPNANAKPNANPDPNPNPNPNPNQVQRLVQIGVLLDGALVVLGLLTLLAGPRRLREPLSLLVGLAVCAAVAHTLLAPYYGGGHPVMSPEEAAAAPY